MKDGLKHIIGRQVAGVNRTRDIARYIEPAAAPCHVSAGRNLEELMTQDLAAWNLAKQAIVRAKLRPDGRGI